MTDSDLLAVRELVKEPSEQSITRTWYQMTKPPKKQRLRWLVPVTAAAAVVILAAGSLIFMRVGEGVFWPADSTPEAVAVLNSLADAAESGTPLMIGAGQVIRTSYDGWGGECSPTSCTLLPQSRDMWFDPRTAKVVKLFDGETDMLSGPKAQSEPQQPEPTAGIAFPTLDWLASLPTDPAELLAALRIEVGEHKSWTVDHQLWDAMGQVYAYCEIALTPQQRAAFLRAFTGMTGLTVQDVTIEGRTLLAIRHKQDDSGQDIYFDPSTGHAVGRASISTHSDLTIIYPSPGPSFEPGTVSQAVWAQTVVDYTS